MTAQSRQADEMTKVIDAQSQQIVQAENPGAPVIATNTPAHWLNVALEKGQTPETLERLMALYERWVANQNRQAFDLAISAAKSAIPPIKKNRKVDFTSQKGRTNYDYEDFAEVARTVDPILAQHGLSYRYHSSQDGNAVTVTCIISHRDGYSEETTLTANRDETGNKNSIQAVASTVTYLQRYTLKLALGLSAAVDDDGIKGGAGETITDEQAKTIRDLIDATGSDIEKFCRVMKVEAVPDIAMTQYGKAISMLEAKRKKGTAA